MQRIVNAVVLAGLALGCGSTGPTELDQLDLAEARWESRGPADYQLELRITCFCPPDYSEWHRVTVEDGAIVALENLATQEPVPADRWDEWYTVDQLFDRIRQFIASDIFGRVEASYHPVLGFPETANLVAHEGVADAGILFQVRSFASDD